MSGHKTIERTHVRKSMSQRGEILMHLKELDAKRLVLSFERRWRLERDRNKH